MTLSKDVLQAYVDGALTQAEMARVESELARDAESQSYVRQQRALLQSLRSAFDPILEAPIPAALSTLTAPARRNRFDGRRWGLWTALPAALALACGVLITLPFRSDIVATDGRLTARGALATALSQQLASDSGQTQIGLSFRDKNGHYCRTFVTGSTLAGVACRQESRWRIAAVGTVAAEASTAYRPAASAMPDFVRSAVTAMLAGEPLDAAAEREQRDAGWR